MHIREQFKNLGTGDLLIARDEAIKQREDLNNFFMLRFVSALGATTTNPKSLPSMIGTPLKTPMIESRLRHFGRVLEDQIGELDFMIEEITEEILARSTK